MYIYRGGSIEDFEKGGPKLRYRLQACIIHRKLIRAAHFSAIFSVTMSSSMLI